MTWVSLRDLIRARKKPESIHLRLLPDQLADLDRWIEHQTDRPTRPEAILRLMTAALAAPKLSRKPPSRRAKRGNPDDGTET